MLGLLVAATSCSRFDVTLSTRNFFRPKDPITLPSRFVKPFSIPANGNSTLRTMMFELLFNFIVGHSISVKNIDSTNSKAFM